MAIKLGGSPRFSSDEPVCSPLTISPQKRLYGLQNIPARMASASAMQHARPDQRHLNTIAVIELVADKGPFCSEEHVVGGTPGCRTTDLQSTFTRTL